MKLRRDVIISLLHYVFFAISGILMNIIISIYHGAEVLGLFNTVYAFYIVISQLGVAGQNYVVLTFSAHAEDDEYSLVLSNSLAIALLVSAVISVVGYFISEYLGQIVKSMDVAEGLRIAIIALPMFTLNKVLLGFLNGVKKIKLFAAHRSLRMFMMLVFVLLISVTDFFQYSLFWVFTFTELIVLLSLLMYNKTWISIKKISYEQIKEYINYGLKSMPIALIAEVNTRVDVICLNLFLSNKLVGIYSFALMFAEGVYQVYIVVRQVVNPYIVEYKQKRQYIYIDFLKPKLLLLNYTIGIIGTVIGLVVFSFITESTIFFEFRDSKDVFTILLIGIVINSYFIIFSNYFVINKLPLAESNIAIIVVLSNVGLNLMLIPILGIVGAAFATVLSYTVGSIAQVKSAIKYEI